MDLVVVGAAQQRLSARRVVHHGASRPSLADEVVEFDWDGERSHQDVHALHVRPDGAVEPRRLTRYLITVWMEGRRRLRANHPLLALAVDVLWGGHPTDLLEDDKEWQRVCLPALERSVGCDHALEGAAADTLHAAWCLDRGTPVPRPTRDLRRFASSARDAARLAAHNGAAFLVALVPCAVADFCAELRAAQPRATVLQRPDAYIPTDDVPLLVTFDRLPAEVPASVRRVVVVSTALTPADLPHELLDAVLVETAPVACATWLARALHPSRRSSLACGRSRTSRGLVLHGDKCEHDPERSSSGPTVRAEAMVHGADFPDGLVLRDVEPDVLQRTLRLLGRVSFRRCDVYSLARLGRQLVGDPIGVGSVVLRTDAM